MFDEEITLHAKHKVLNCTPNRCTSASLEHLAKCAVSVQMCGTNVNLHVFRPRLNKSPVISSVPSVSRASATGEY